MFTRYLRAVFATLAFVMLLFAAFVVLGAAPYSRAQEPPAAPPSSSTPPAESSTSKSVMHPRPPQGFLIRGTVFDSRGFSLPGAELRIRRAAEKKFHWNTYTNSRGEFAIRVPPGNQYQVVVQSKGFPDAAQPVNAGNGLDEQSLVFRMDPPGGKK